MDPRTQLANKLNAIIQQITKASEQKNISDDLRGALYNIRNKLVKIDKIINPDQYLAQSDTQEKIDVVNNAELIKDTNIPMYQDVLEAFLPIMKYIESIKYNQRSSIFSMFRKNEPATAIKHYGSQLVSNMRTSFATDNEIGGYELIGAEMDVLKKIHSQLANLLKSEYQIAWVFNYSPDKIDTKNWLQGFEENINNSNNNIHIADNDFIRNVTVNNERLSEIPVLIRDNNIDDKQYEFLQKQFRQLTLKSFLSEKLADANYNSNEYNMLINWLACNGGQTMNQLFIKDLISEGCFYDKGDDVLVTISAIAKSTNWHVNEYGKIELDFNFDVTGLGVNGSQKNIMYDVNLGHYREVPEHEFEEVRNAYKASGLTKPSMNIQAKIELMVENNKVLPVIRQCYVTSYTNLLQSPARFEEPKYVNDSQFSPVLARKRS